MELKIMKEDDFLNSKLEKGDKLSLIDIIEISEHLKLNSLLKVTTSTDTGSILFENGKISNCEIEGKLYGDEAFNQLLKINSDFEFYSLTTAENPIKMEIFLLEPIENTENSEEVEIEFKINEKYEPLCKQLMNKNDDIFAVSILDLSEKAVVALDIKDNNETNLEIVKSFSKLYFETQKSENIIEIDSLFRENVSGDKSYLMELNLLGSFSQVSKLVKDNFVINLIFSENLNKVFALKLIQNCVTEFEKIF